MTNAEFVELYKGRRVVMNALCLNENNPGRKGVVVGLGSGIDLEMNDGTSYTIDACYKLDLIEEVDRKPLPLPG
jgi:hypothetical protein